VETATIGEIALLVVGLAGLLATTATLRAALHRHAWLRWSGNDRAARVARRQVRSKGARLAACGVAALVGAIGAITSGWFFHRAGMLLALGLGFSVGAELLDALEDHRHRGDPDIRAELDAEELPTHPVDAATS
jgi:hypothetical protein